VGAGWGHGVGLSQYGAYAQARAGRDAQQILQHYYQGITFGEVADTGVVSVRLFREWSGSGSAPLDQNLREAPVTASGGPVAWVICPAGADCRDEVQPEGTTWTVRAVGGDTPARIELRDDTGSARYGGNGRVEVRLTPPDVVPPAERPTVRVTSVNPSGGRGTNCAGTTATGRACYGFGHLEFRGASSQLLVTNRLSMGAYLRGLGEVPSSWGNATADGSSGAAALAAQAIVGRTYVLGRNADTCATAACQVFLGLTQELPASGHRWVAAVRDTAGVVLRTSTGAFAQTFYSSSHGGRSENVEDSWAYGTTAIDHLRSVDDPWSVAPGVGNPCTSWERRTSNVDASNLFGGAIPQTLHRVTRVRILSRTTGGTPRELEVRGVDTAGVSRTFTFTRPGTTGKQIAGAHIRTSLPVAATRPGWTAADSCFRSSRTPSSQIRGIGLAPFVDDDGGTHEYTTVWANEAGVASGLTTTTFGPSQDVTRAQMATFIANTFRLPDPTGHHFDDVPVGSTHARTINALYEAGIASGTGERRFSPEAPITRAQMATFLANAAGWDRPTSQTRFADVPPQMTHASAIAAIDREGVTSGCTADRYCPQDHVTRGQMTAFLYRLVRG
jgi:SpoIID/LytB domain protein